MNQDNLIDKMLKSFRLSLVNVKIYPPTSPLVENQISELYSCIKQLLQDKTFIVISEMDGKLFINESEYSSKDPNSIANITHIAQFFIQTGIKSITFKKELNINELKDFFISSTVRKPKLSPKEIILQTIKEKDIKNITIDEVEYITVLKSDQTVKSILDKIKQPVSDLTEYLKVVGDVFNELDKIKDETTKKNLLNTVAKYTSSLDINIVKDLFTQPLPQKIEQYGFKQLVFNNLTKQNVEEIFNEIITWCKRLRSQTENEAEYLEQLQHLKDFIKLVVNSPVSKLVPIEIFEELFKIGLLDALPEWIVQQKEEKKSWIAELDELLSSNEPTKLLQEKFLTNLEENIEKLCMIGLDDKLEKITSLLSENFSNPVVKLRQLAASSIENIAKQVVKYQKTKVAKNIVSNILKYIIKEQDDTVVNQYMLAVENSLSCLIMTKDFTSFAEYAKQLLFFAEELRKVNPQKSTLIYQTLDRIYNKTKEIILESLSKQEGNLEDILWYLRYISEKSIDIIIEAIISTNNQTTIKILTDLLNSFKQEDVVGTITGYLTPQTPSHKTAKIIEILDKFTYDFSEVLKQLFNYTIYANKVAILNYIQQKPTEENLAWLTSLLTTQETQILEYVVDILTTLEYKPASENLLYLLSKTKDIDLKKRICISLGVLKETKAINKLKKIINSKPSLFSKGEPIELRIAACWSLSNFITLPEIKSYFQKLVSNKKDTAISKIANEILQNK